MRFQKINRMEITELIKKKHHWVYISLTAIVIVAVVLYYALRQPADIYVVKKDKFEAVITSKGEIQSEIALEISFPDEMRSRDLNIYQTKIKDLVPEGTIVKKGDYVALLDEVRIKELISFNDDNLRRMTAVYNDSKIDSAVTLTTARDELEQLAFDLRYKKIDLEQSIYDSPANQRKTQLAYDRTERTIESKKRSYKLQQNDLKERCTTNENMYLLYKDKSDRYQKALAATRITSPKDGMIIYARNWQGGKKTKIGDWVDIWDPEIATLPDLSKLVSETFVEEIYISKIHIGDSVRVHIDAVNNKVVLAVITNISNIGQEMPGFDSNVFKVFIRLTGDLSKFTPSMTTTNEIIVEKVENALVMPLVCLFIENGTPFVYLRKSGKIVRQKVVTGEKNDKMVLIKSGLKEGDKLMLSKPENKDI
jgi:multidrug efflux pump subunit AcrA (membrane-fusion protein)